MFSDFWNKKIDDCLDQKIQLYEVICDFINDENIAFGINEELIHSFKDQNILEDKQSLKEFLHLLKKISNNHYRHPNMFKKIEEILTFLKEVMNDMFSNSELFSLFKNNKLLLLFLFDNKFINVDELIANYILQKESPTGVKYCHFFYPEIKTYISEKDKKTIETELSNIDKDIYQQARHEGENNSYICKLIRSDSIEEFIILFSKGNFSLSSTIKSSPFETNSFLLKNNPSIIEYASFFGSIQIFNFLCMNRVKLEQSLWIYSIHSNNAYLIHRLEENEIELNNEMFEKCIEESIKCHHNEFTSYFQDQLIKESFVLNKSVAEYGFRYHNYYFFSEEMNDKELFYYSCHYDYYNVVQFLLHADKHKATNEIIITSFYFIQFYLNIFLLMKFKIIIFSSSFNSFFINEISN